MIRSASSNPQDADKAKRIWAEVFGDPEKYLQWYFSTVYQPQNTLFYEEDGDLAAHLQMRKFDILLQGSRACAGYLAGVATYPRFRQRGFGSELIKRAFECLRSKGIDYCFLVPTTFHFYERLGFATCYDKTVCTVSADKYPSPSGGLWQELTENSGAYIDLAYHSALRGCGGYVLRSDMDWKIFLQDNLYNNKAQCRFVDDDGACGYYIAKEDMDRNCLFVPEIGYNSAAVRDAVFSQLSLLAKNCDRIELILPSPHSDVLGSCQTQPYGMGRILSAENALKLCAKSFNGTVSIKVRDSVIAENNRIFALQNGSVTEGVTYDAEMDISTLAMLVWGYIDIYDGSRTGLISGDISAADGLFKKQNNYLDNSILAF